MTEIIVQSAKLSLNSRSWKAHRAARTVEEMSDISGDRHEVNFIKKSSNAVTVGH